MCALLEKLQEDRLSGLAERVKVRKDDRNRQCRHAERAEQGAKIGNRVISTVVDAPLDREPIGIAEKQDRE